MLDKPTRRFFTLIFAIYLTMLLGYISHNPETNTKALSQATPAGYSVALETPPQSHPIVLTDPAYVRAEAKRWFLQREHLDEWKCIDEIIYRESRWIPNLYNTQGSGAYGLGQVKGSDKYTKNKPHRQFKTAVRYAIYRYGTLCNALKAHNKQGWY